MGHEATATARDSAPALVTLEEALKKYPCVTIRSGREWIKRGRLPAVKIGKSYLVSPDDLARLLTPVLRAPATKPRRESERARIARQLANAGIGT